MPSVSYLKGQPASAELLNKSNSVLSVPGISTPAIFDVRLPTTLVVSKHSGMFGNGVTYTESETISLDTSLYFTAGSAAYHGTVLYRIDPQLYMKPTLSIEPGYLTQDLNPNILVVGWVNYPGSSVALDATHFLPAQVSDLFRYTYYATARDIFSSLSVSSSPDTLDKWYAAKNAGSGSPTYAVYLVLNGTVNPSTSPLVTIKEINGEYFTVVKNIVGQPNLDLVVELCAWNGNNYASSLHTRMYIDAGVNVTTGIQFRGLDTEITLDTGSVSGGLVDAGIHPGTYVFSLLKHLPSKPAESLRIRYHVTLPAGKSIGFGSVGLGNMTLFEQLYTAD